MLVGLPRPTPTPLPLDVLASLLRLASPPCPRLKPFRRPLSTSVPDVRSRRPPPTSPLGAPHPCPTAARSPPRFGDAPTSLLASPAELAERRTRPKPGAPLPPPSQWAFFALLRHRASPLRNARGTERASPRGDRVRPLSPPLAGTERPLLLPLAGTERGLCRSPSRGWIGCCCSPLQV